MGAKRLTEKNALSNGLQNEAKNKVYQFDSFKEFTSYQDSLEQIKKRLEAHHQSYELVMAGNKAALYVKKSAYPHIEAFDFKKWLESKYLTHQLSEKKVYELLRTEPLNFRGILYHALTLQVKYLHSKYMKTGIFAYRNGQYAVAERLYLKYLEETKGGDVNVFVNLGSLYMRQKQYNKARLCYIQARKIIPDNPLVKKRLQVLNSRIAPKFY